MINMTWSKTKGDIHNRLERSYDRMHSEWYTADKVFVADGNNWPGDWEGRTILALTSLGKVLGREPEQLEQMIHNLMGHLNEKQYLGDIRECKTFDEQQISGHSWLLRGLIDYYQWKEDIQVLAVIKGIANNLMKPVHGYYKDYPMKPEERIVSGEAAGDLTGKKIGHWLTSSDIGCAFIMLDGITKAYELLKDETLEPLIEEMIEAYFTMDFIKLSVQTHATLSGLRGIIRYSLLKGDGTFIKRCEDVFAIYLAHGRTENYANYNWFGRPTWTEPCAIVDAFMVSVELAKATGKTIYIEEANYIYYNALSYAQRGNGGFGCDVCSGAEDDSIKPQDGIFEAYWCCTMRGANGLAYILEEGIQVRDDCAKFYLYHEGSTQIFFEDGSMTLEMTGDLHRNGKYHINVKDNKLTTPKGIHLFIPSWVEEFKVLYNGVSYTETTGGYVEIIIQPGQNQGVDLTYDIKLRKETTLNSNTIAGVFRYLHGYLMLAYDSGESDMTIDEHTTLAYEGDGSYRAKDSNVSLKPLMDFVEAKHEDDRYSSKKMLFCYS